MMYPLWQISNATYWFSKWYICLNAIFLTLQFIFGSKDSISNNRKHVAVQIFQIHSTNVTQVHQTKWQYNGEKNLIKTDVSDISNLIKTSKGFNANRFELWIFFLKMINFVKWNDTVHVLLNTEVYTIMVRYFNLEYTTLCYDLNCSNAPSRNLRLI